MTPRIAAHVALALLTLAGPLLAAEEGSAGDAAGEQLAASRDGFLALRLEPGIIVVTLLDGAKVPVAVEEGSGTMFLTYLEDGHKSKVALTLETGSAGSRFTAPIPAEAHGPTKAVVSIRADGASHQGSFELSMPKPAR